MRMIAGETGRVGDTGPPGARGATGFVRMGRFV